MSGTHGVLADVMTASVNGEDRSIMTVLDDAMFVEADQTQCTKASRELRRLLTRHTGVGSGNIRHRNGRRGSVEQTAHQLQQEGVGENVPWRRTRAK